MIYELLLGTEGFLEQPGIDLWVCVGLLLIKSLMVLI